MSGGPLITRTSDVRTPAGGVALATDARRHSADAPPAQVFGPTHFPAISWPTGHRRRALSLRRFRLVYSWRQSPNSIQAPWQVALRAEAGPANQALPVG